MVITPLRPPDRIRRRGCSRLLRGAAVRRLGDLLRLHPRLPLGRDHVHDGVLGRIAVFRRAHTNAGDETELVEIAPARDLTRRLRGFALIVRPDATRTFENRPQGFARAFSGFGVPRLRALDHKPIPEFPFVIRPFRDDHELAIEAFARTVSGILQPSVLAGATGPNGHLQRNDCVRRDRVERALFAGAVEVEIRHVTSPWLRLSS
jgi:hypothetical protein